MDYKKFAIGSLITAGLASSIYFLVEGIRLRKITKKLTNIHTDIEGYKDIALAVIEKGEKEEAEILLSSLTEDERRLKAAIGERDKAITRRRTIGKTLLNIVPSFLHFLANIASSPIVVEKKIILTEEEASEEQLNQEEQ